MSAPDPTTIDAKQIVIERYSREILSKLPAVAEVMAVYKVEMTKANELTKSDIRAGVEQMALAVGRLNDALGVDKLPLLHLLTMIADLRRGKVQEWARRDIDSEGVGAGNLTDTAECHRRAWAVALLAVLQEEDGLRKGEAALRIARALRKRRPALSSGTIQQWARDLDNYLPADDPTFFPKLVELLRPLSPETAIATVADSFAEAR